MTRDEAARQAAVEQYDSDVIDFDHDADVSHSESPGTEESGAWVAAWVYVPASAIDNHEKEEATT